MNDVGKEYGEAIFAVADEIGKRNEYAAILESIKAEFEKNPDFLTLLSTPCVPLKERLAIIDKTFRGVGAEYILSYLKLLCEKGRLEYFGASVERYTELLNAFEKTVNAKITSAVPLSDDEKLKLITKLQSVENCKVLAEYYIDESLIGGMIIEINGKVIDGSLRYRLREIKDVVIK